MAELKLEEKQKLFAKYLSENKVFIVDCSSASRRRLAKTMIGLGANMNQISLYGSFEEAQTNLPKLKPKVVICDYMLGNRSGLDLLQDQRAAFPESKDCLFILITADSSQSAVARAAEEDVDSFILKPYTMKTLIETLLQSSFEKLFPNQYRRAINEGKELLFSQRLDESMIKFKEAMTLDPSPSLAHFYYGQAEAMKQALDEAQDSYKAGLSYNKIHYKCLVGLYTLLSDQKKYEEAYSIVKRVAQYFPANPKRLAEVIRLAVVTHNFKDMENYYQIFTQLDERNEEVIKYVCAGLITAAKYFLGRGEKQRALDILSKVAISAAGRTQFLRVMIETLAAHGFAQEASTILARFPSESQSGADYQIAQFLVSDQLDPPGKTIPLGRNLIKNGINTASTDLALLKKLLLFPALYTEARGLSEDAKRRWPEKGELFPDLPETPPGNS